MEVARCIRIGEKRYLCQAYCDYLLIEPIGVTYKITVVMGTQEAQIQPVGVIFFSTFFTCRTVEILVKPFPANGDLSSYPWI